MDYRAGSGPWIHDDKTGEVEMRHIARCNRVAKFERNGRDHEIYRRPVAARELSSANGSPFVEGQHMARVGHAKRVEPSAQGMPLR